MTTYCANKPKITITVISQNGPSSYYVKHVLTESNQLLEAFGNAKTQHCDNSSRFGKYTTIYFGFGDRIEGGKISTVSRYWLMCV